MRALNLDSQTAPRRMVAGNLCDLIAEKRYGVACSDHQFCSGHSSLFIYGLLRKVVLVKWSKWLEKWDMTSLKIKVPFLEMEWEPRDEDREAAWELYIELLTRITTQPLAQEHGDEETALASVYSIFPITREVIKRNSRHCIEFTKIAVVVLNQIIRPFSAKWHRLSVKGAFSDAAQCAEFRVELEELQGNLRKYSKMLADMANVEDLTELEDCAI